MGQSCTSLVFVQESSPYLGREEDQGAAEGHRNTLAVHWLRKSVSDLKKKKTRANHDQHETHPHLTRRERRRTRKSHCGNRTVHTARNKQRASEWDLAPLIRVARPVWRPQNTCFKFSVGLARKKPEKTRMLGCIVSRLADHLMGEEILGVAMLLIM